jgi:hypothetical protein
LLTGVIAAGTGVNVRDDSNSLGVSTTLVFGNNLTVDLSPTTGIGTISIDSLNITGLSTLSALKVTGIATVGVVTSGTSIQATNFYGNLSGTATNANNINISATSSSDTITSIVLVGDQTVGNQSPFVDGGLTYNANTNTLSASAFVGDGSGLTNTGSTLSATSGIERLVMTNQTSGTMTASSTDSDLRFDATNKQLLVGTGLTIAYNSSKGFARLQFERGNVFFGDNVGPNLQFGSPGGCSGTNNFVAGLGAGTSLTSGCNNTFIGQYAGCTVTSATLNNFIGINAGKYVTTGSNNNFFGNGAGRRLNGCYNNAFGPEAGQGQSGSTGSHNNFFGKNSGSSIQNGSNNNFFGNCAGLTNSNGSNNNFLGACAGCLNNNGADNNFLGYRAGWCSSGSWNNFFGREAGSDNTGNYNNFFGYRVGLANTSGGSNNFIGQCAGYSNSVGCHNNFFGSNAGGCNTTGSRNISIGKDAGIGGSNSSGNDNTFLGELTGKLNSTGSGNIFLGRYAGCTNTTGSCNVTIGYAAVLPSATGSCQLSIGADGNYWIQGNSFFNVGLGTDNPTSKLHVFGDARFVGVVTATDFNSASDAKLKTNIQPIADPLEKIVQIQGVSFNWISNNKPAMGVIADELQKVLPELVNDSDPKTVNYNGLIGLLIEVVKEQQIQINEMNERLSRLE